MSYGLVGMYAIYMMFVGVNGNAGVLFADVGEDAKGFAPWLLSIFVLRALANVDVLAPAVKPFMGLAILTFTLKNYDTLVSQLDAVTGLQLKGTSA
jgi:hypothetical protein